MSDLQNIMTTCNNPYVSVYKNMHAVELQERAYSTNQNIQPRPVKMIFRDDRPELDSRRYNVPQHDDVAAVFVGNDGLPNPHDICVYPKSNRLKYFRTHQNNLRSELYFGLMDHSENEPMDPNIRNPGRPFILKNLHLSEASVTRNKIIKILWPLVPNFHELYQIITSCMMHGPCGNANRQSSCMVNNECSKHFPKSFQPETTMDGNGYPLYMRRDNGITVEKNGVILDNRHVVP